jgi:hypothetical protein
LDFNYILLPICLAPAGIVMLYFVLKHRRERTSGAKTLFVVFAVVALLELTSSWSCIQINREEALMSCAGDGDMAGVRELLDQNTDPNAEFEDGSTPIMFAAGSGHVDVVKLLLSRGARVNDRNSQGQTAFDQTDSTEMKKVLIAAGGKP